MRRYVAIGACSYSRISHFKSTFCFYKYIIWVRPSFQCRGRAERTARVVRMVPGPAFLANEFDILFEVRFHSRTHVSSDPSPTNLYLPGAISSPIDATLDTDPACPPSSPSSFSFRHSVHEELPGATSKCRRVHRPGGQRALLDPPRHDARVPGAHLVRPPRRNSVRLLLFISVRAIVLMTSCFV